MSIFEIFKKNNKSDNEIPSIKVIKYCTNCGAGLYEDSNFCHICGKSVVEEKNICNSCGRTVLKTSNFCSSCGSDLRKLEIIQAEEKAKNEKENKIDVGVISQINQIISEDNIDTLDNDIETQNDNYKETDQNEIIISDDYSNLNDKETNDTINVKEEISTLEDDITNIVENNYSSKIEDLKTITSTNETSDTLDEMIEFINKNVLPGVYYSVLYGKYKMYCEMLNIKNAKELKAGIDSYISEKYYKNEKFISMYDDERYIKEHISKIIQKYEQSFSIYDIWKLMPGIQWPVLEELLKELCDKNIIMINEKSPLVKYVKSQCVSEENIIETNDDAQKKEKINVVTNVGESIELLDKYLKELFEEIKFDYVSDVRFLGRLEILDEKLVSKLELTRESLRVILHKWFKEKYYYNSMFIGQNEIISPREMVVKYFKETDMINHKMILDFFNLIGYSNHKSYKIYFDELIENGYVRLDDEIVIKKDKFIIDDESLGMIKGNLDIFFENSKSMDTSKINRFFYMMPKIKYTWNSYVLVLILEKYFSNEYEITIKDDKNYTIRRK